MNTEPFGKRKEILPKPGEMEVKRVQETSEIGNIETISEGGEFVEPVEHPEEASLSEHALSSKSPVSPVPVALPQKDRLTKEVEAILEDDLKELYASMPADKQVLFRQKGEETLSIIRVLLSQTKVNAKKIFDLIRDWLKLIPGVNRFFLEQEAKIKTDKILLVNEEERKESL